MDKKQAAIEAVAKFYFQFIRGDNVFNQEAWERKLDDKQRSRILYFGEQILSLSEVAEYFKGLENGNAE